MTTDLKLIRKACKFTQPTTNLRRLPTIHLTYKFPPPVVTLPPKTTNNIIHNVRITSIISNGQIRRSISLHPSIHQHPTHQSKLRHEIICLRCALTARTLLHHPADRKQIAQTTPDTLELTPPAGSSNFNRSWRNMQRANCSPLDEFSLPAAKPTKLLHRLYSLTHSLVTVVTVIPTTSAISLCSATKVCGPA